MSVFIIESRLALNSVPGFHSGIASAFETMNPTFITQPDLRHEDFSLLPYQSTHNTGGTIMGADRATSVVNKYLQSWDVSNVFVVGASVFTHNSSYNPTGPVGALAYRLADTLKEMYLKRPEPLA